MQIDRSNYELWLIDWLDGNLDEVRIKQLQFFLNENPDLKTEFDEIEMVKLSPSGKSFAHKNDLRKMPANISESQFEYLSAAYLENDLSPDQQSELNESIEIDPGKKRTFEMMQKMKLSPIEVIFTRKSRLIKRTAAQKVIWLSLIGLSAAAIISIVIITYFPKPKDIQVQFKKTALNIPTDSILIRRAIKITDHAINSEKKIISSTIQRNLLVAGSQEKVPHNTETGPNQSSQKDSLVRLPDNPTITLNKIRLSTVIVLKEEPLHNTLIASSSIIPVQEEDDGRSRLGKFIAKTFREKILKEKAAKDSPLKIYEIAEAGVSGLDKLLGWEMALDERKDENGELKSVYFSSKILKFNAPIKKTEPLP